MPPLATWGFEGGQEKDHNSSQTLEPGPSGHTGISFLKNCWTVSAGKSETWVLITLKLKWQIKNRNASVKLTF